MGKRLSILVILIGLGTLAGCSRQDTECLGSIGRKIMDRAGKATVTYRDKLDGLKNLRGNSDNLQERVALRLRWEKVLADTPIDVVVNGKEIELNGTVKNAEQRARATEIAEATAGVEHVSNNLNLAESPPSEKKDD